MRVLVLTGAGVSAESGIPTFRGKDGYWRNLDPTKLATPEAFASDPELVWEWYRERRQRIRSAKPNAAHEAIVRLSTFAREFLLVTQNVDDLHTRSGLPKEKMVQIHGNIFVTRCSRCDLEAEEAEEEEVEHDYEHPPSLGYGMAGEHEHDKIPKCPECGALMRPGVVWFGEQLDSNKIDIVEMFVGGGRCDCVFVIGTTALFGYIVDWAIRARGQSGELIEINPDETPLSQFATQVVREPAAAALPRIVDEIIRCRSSSLDADNKGEESRQ